MHPPREKIRRERLVEKIDVYGVAYWIEDYVQRSIESIKSHTKRPLNFRVIENKSPHDLSHLAPMVDEWISDDHNYWERCMNRLLKEYPPTSEIVILTDLDLLVPDGVDWVEETLRRFENKYVGLTAFDLDSVNFTEANGTCLFSDGYTITKELGGYQIPSGAWLMGIRKTLLEEYLRTHDYTLDIYLTKFVNDKKYHLLRMPDKLYHLGWDAWRDYPEYHQTKLDRREIPLEERE